MTHYSTERKESVLSKMLPPHNMTIAAISREEGISVLMGMDFECAVAKQNNNLSTLKIKI
ncbi:hypothetical protein SOPP22_16465 [Shewanella sp. OPT22]|nr:hypothetical protein SOPP22_16465 [Shewanella sp. OPT22]